jgi:hypothetical protein
MFGALCFGGILQDRMRQKAGGSPFSVGHLWRCFGTRELYFFALLVVLLTATAFGFIMLDDLGYLRKSG